MKVIKIWGIKIPLFQFFFSPNETQMRSKTSLEFLFSGNVESTITLLYSGLINMDSNLLSYTRKWELDLPITIKNRNGVGFGKALFLD